MCSDESVICHGSFEGSVIVHLISKMFVVESGIIYIYICFEFILSLVHFLLWLWLGSGYLRCICVQQIRLGLELGLGFADTRTIKVGFFRYVCNQVHMMKREK